MRVAIFASGNGTNFEVLAKHFQSKQIPGTLALLFCDHPDAPVVQRAHRLGVPVVTFTVKECGGKQAYEERIATVLADYQIDFIALAGYMRVIEAPILTRYEGRIINLHPAMLPDYQGLHAIERSFADRSPRTGVTLHYIDAGLDTGPIIRQEHVPVQDDDTEETFEQRIHACEHRLYPQVLAQVLATKMKGDD